MDKQIKVISIQIAFKDKINISISMQPKIVCHIAIIYSIIYL